MIRESAWMARHAAHRLRGSAAALRREAKAWRRFWAAYAEWGRTAPSERRPTLRHLYPCLLDATTETAVEPTYFFQDAWAFERIVEARPERHVDVASHHKFTSLLSKVVPVTMVDIRPLDVELESLRFREGSITSLPFADGAEGSVSSLCVVEHIGLGRYGDPLDPYGSEKAIAELKRIVRPGGDLYISAPLDDVDRVYFNAHRAFAEETLLRLLEPFEVVERRYIYGMRFGTERQPGVGTGCYHVRRPETG